MAFAQWWNGTQGAFWTSEESYHTLSSEGQAVSPIFQFDYEQTFVAAPYGRFTLVDGDHTQYEFNQVRWNISEIPPDGVGYAIPYFLLTKIMDRWGRLIQVNWSGAGVSSVIDGNGRGLSFTYSGGVLAGVTDPAGRAHSLQHTQVPTRSGGTQPRLTGVTE
jgi:hypothetical protein